MKPLAQLIVNAAQEIQRLSGAKPVYLQKAQGETRLLAEEH